MKLIIALGNPGLSFERTRHNVGFMALDYFVIKQKIPALKQFKKEDAFYHKDQNFILLKPLSYMNNSGEPTKKIVNFFKIKPENILVIYDDINLPIGKIRCRYKGSHGGHNGIKNVLKHLDNEKIKRIRIGVDSDVDIPLSKWVLSNFEKEEEIRLNTVFANVIEIINLFLEDNFSQGMNDHN